MEADIQNGPDKAVGAMAVLTAMLHERYKAGIALGMTGLVVGTTVFFEAGVVILIPLAFGLAKKTKKSTLYYVIPLLAGLAAGLAPGFLPISRKSVKRRKQIYKIFPNKKKIPLIKQEKYVDIILKSCLENNIHFYNRQL